MEVRRVPQYTRPEARRRSLLGGRRSSKLQGMMRKDRRTAYVPSAPSREPAGSALTIDLLELEAFAMAHILRWQKKPRSLARRCARKA